MYTYKTDLDSLHFDSEPRVQEKQQVLHQQPYVSIDLGYPTYLSNNYKYQLTHDNTISDNIGCCRDKGINAQIFLDTIFTIETMYGS